MDIKNTPEFQQALERLCQMRSCKTADIPKWAREKLEFACAALYPESHPMGSYVILAAMVAAEIKIGFGGQKGLTGEGEALKGPTPGASDYDIDVLIGGKSFLASFTWRKAALEHPEKVQQLIKRPKLGPGKKALGAHALKLAKGLVNNDIQEPVKINA